MLTEYIRYTTPKSQNGLNAFVQILMGNVKMLYVRRHGNTINMTKSL